MDNNAIITELTSVERKVLPHIKEDTKANELVEKTSLKEIEVLRAIMWLSNKELATLKKEEIELITLDTNGLSYKENGLPEKKLLEEIKDKPKTLSELKSISKEEINASIGLLKKTASINTEKTDKGPKLSITDNGKNLLKKETLEEKFLQIKFPIKETELAIEYKKIYEDFKKRKFLVKKEKKTTWSATITSKGKEISALAKDDKTIYEEKITPKILKTKSWKNTKFRSFDVESKVPRISRGKKHFVTEAIEYMRQIWLELGFEEMKDNEVQSAFWDLDALFVPQDHPAREMQDTYYINKESKLPTELFKKVKEVHENGANTGSKGWQTKYDINTAKETLLRTHTTVVSAHTLTKLKREELPKKFFIIGKVYRNEALDWKHLFEFRQVDGIVIDPEASLTKLKGYLKEFFTKMGFSDVRIRPAHFPYTEPSAEVEAYNEHKKEWVEMGGCGIFRPEVTKTLLGFECPILAWGLGMERIITAYYNIKDLREIYKNDLEQIQNMKSFMK